MFLLKTLTMSFVIIIFLAFAVIHSITVTGWFKRLCANAFGDTFMRVGYRFLYNAVSGGTAFLAIFLLAHIPDQVIWRASAVPRITLRIMQLAGFMFGILSFKNLDAGEFMGIRQVWRYLRSREVAGNSEGLTQKELVTTGVYGIVRHPLYVAGLVIFTFSPDITVNGLLITVMADLYFLFGMFIEERRFLRIYGDRYREYMLHVPRMLPRICSR